jgi:YD repeat-containing protein
MDIYSIDPTSGSFGIVGVGQVNPGGTAIDTIAGGITAATWFGFLGPPLNIDASGNNSEIQDPEKCVRCDSGSGTHVSSGNLTADHSLASYRSLNQTRGLRFVYNSTGADPRPVIVTDTTMPMRSAVPNTLSARLNVAGVAQDSEVFTSTTGLSDSVDETVHQAVQFDAAEFATGVYTHDLTVTSNFALSSIGIRQSGEVLVNNEQGSPFGAGWTLDGLERLHVQANGVIILTQGDGSILRFPSLASASGTFGPPINSDASSTFFQARLAIADFNGDGALDLAVPDDGFDLYLGDGQGQFPVVRENPCTGCSDSVRAQTGDFNNDGLPDVIVSHGLSGATRKVTLHLGLGSGFFAPAVDIPFSDRPTDLAVADFDQDGNDDFVTALSIDLGIRFGDGAGGFPGSRTLGLDDFARAIAVADLNGDSLPDILARETTFGDGQLSVFLNNPLDPGFFTRTIFVLPGSDDVALEGFQQIRTADFNSDGNLDVAVKDVNADNVRILFGDGTGDFPSSVVLSTGSIDLIEIDVADFNGDGNPDLVCDYRNLTGIPVGVAVMFGDGQGGFSSPAITPIVGASGSMFAVRAGDFDGDGIPDVVTGIFGDDVFAVLPNVVSGVPDVFASPAGDFSTLVENLDNSFTRTLKNGTAIEYDADGFMTAAVDRNGNTTAYAYDGGGNLTTITDPVGLVTTLAYTGGLLTSVTDPAGRITGFAHDPDGNLTEITDLDLSERLFAYDSRHRLTSQTSKRGFVTSYDYGPHGRNVRADRPDSSFTLTAPSEVAGLIDVAAGLGTPANPAPFTRPEDAVASFTDGNGNATVFELDKFGGATGRTDALGRTTETVRDGNSLVTETTAANGRVDQMTYDGQGNLLTRTEAVGDALERVTALEYEPVFNLVTKITDPRGNETTFAYDGNGNLTTTTDAALTQTVMVYGDANCPGLVTSVTRAASRMAFGSILARVCELNKRAWSRASETPMAGHGPMVRRWCLSLPSSSGR